MKSRSKDDLKIFTEFPFFLLRFILDTLVKTILGTHPNLLWEKLGRIELSLIYRKCNNMVSKYVIYNQLQINSMFSKLKSQFQKDYPYKTSLWSMREQPCTLSLKILSWLKSIKIVRLLPCRKSTRKVQCHLLFKRIPHIGRFSTTISSEWKKIALKWGSTAYTNQFLSFVLTSLENL